MGQAIDRLIALSGAERVGEYTRTTASGKVVTVHAYTRSPGKMASGAITSELKSLADKTDDTSKARASALQAEKAKRISAGVWNGPVKTPNSPVEKLKAKTGTFATPSNNMATMDKMASLKHKVSDAAPTTPLPEGNIKDSAAKHFKTVQVSASDVKRGDVIVHAGEAHMVHEAKTVNGETTLQVSTVGNKQSTIRAHATEIFQKVVLGILAAIISAGVIGAVSHDIHQAYDHPDTSSITQTTDGGGSHHLGGDNAKEGREQESPHAHDEHEFEAIASLVMGAGAGGTIGSMSWTTKDGHHATVPVEQMLRTVNELEKHQAYRHPGSGAKI